MGKPSRAMIPSLLPQKLQLHAGNPVYVVAITHV